MMGFFETVFPPGWQLYVLIMVIFGLILFIVSLFLNKDENKEIKLSDEEKLTVKEEELRWEKMEK